MAAKYLNLAAELRQLCVQLHRQGERKFPSEPELCRQTGYSRETVRRALALLEQEGLLTRERGSGTYLADALAGRSGRIAVVVCCEGDYLYPQLLRDIESVCRPRGFRTEAYFTENRTEREREILTGLLADPPAGILMEGAKTALPSPNLDLLTRLGKLGIPLVWLHAPHGVPSGSPCVQDDNAGGGRLLTRYLLDKGHREIAGLFKYDDRQGPERYEGCVTELAQAGLSPADAHVRWYGTEERDAILKGRLDWLHRFVHTGLGSCSAVVCYNDEIAYPLIQCLLAAGYRVPEDVAVVSFDNSHYCRLSPVSITSLGHERHQMGSSAALTLLTLMRGRQAHSSRLPWMLYERGSG
ncbi:MAG: GntR family transcriptional regulator [Oscillospiraceae bacterium]|nr:GntR family transcriptional regulator [Oscillospiraceae bacterium]